MNLNLLPTATGGSLSSSRPPVAPLFPNVGPEPCPEPTAPVLKAAALTPPRCARPGRGSSCTCGCTERNWAGEDGPCDLWLDWHEASPEWSPGAEVGAHSFTGVFELRPDPDLDAVIESFECGETF